MTGPEIPVDKRRNTNEHIYEYMYLYIYSVERQIERRDVIYL